MDFDYRGFTRFVRRALFPERGAPYRLTVKRAVLLAGFFPIFYVTEAIARSGFLLDDLLFGAYRRQPIVRPVFIIGNPRSGTTYLQRVLAKDRRTFTSMRMWEVLFAPSVTQRRAAQLVFKLAGRNAARLRRAFWRLEQVVLGKNRVHESSLLAPEEDQYYMVHIWSALIVWHLAGMLDETEVYTGFDTRMSLEDQDRIMSFYRRGIQRHLYAHRGRSRRTRHYLSKNPSATPKVAALYRHFPDARLIYLVRNPLDMVPSMVSVIEYAWQLLGNPPKPYMARDNIIEMAQHWYNYPLEQLDQADEASYLIIRYEDLVSDVQATVQRIYKQFGFRLHPQYVEYLRRETVRERRYESTHTYDLAKMGLSGEQIVADFWPIFERFNFDTRGFSGPEG
jgi:omega-hydroxy-beta-dihydromenaquinone-9 sulfotransferase